MSVENVETVAKTEPVAVAPEKTAVNTEAKKPSPAQDLRDIQALLVSGIFPGNFAPQIVKAYQTLEQMAQKVEQAATPQETK